MVLVHQIPHWLATTGHVLYAIWPWAATAIAGLLVAFTNGLVKELDETQSRVRELTERATDYQNRWYGAIRDHEHETQRGWEEAARWEARLRRQQDLCAKEHMDRPLLTNPLSPERIRELELELPF